MFGLGTTASGLRAVYRRLIKAVAESTGLMCQVSQEILKIVIIINVSTAIR